MKEQYAEMPIYFGLAARRLPPALKQPKSLFPDLLNIPVIDSVPKLARQSLRMLSAERKVRAPQSRMPVNDRTP